MTHELHHEARRDQRIDDAAERKETAHDRNDAEDEQGHVRKPPRRVKPTERFEEVSFPGRRIRHARVAEQQRKDRSERRPQNHQGEDAGYPRPVDLLHEDGHDEIGVRLRLGGDELPPWHDADDREIDRQVDHRHRRRADQDGSRDDAARILHLVADVADVVVAEVVVNADPRRGAETDEKADRERERARREIERHVAVEVAHAGHHHRDRGDNRPHPQRDRDRPNRADPAIQQHDVDDADGDGDADQSARRQAVPDVAEILRKPDVAGRDLERPAQDELPDEEKSQQPSVRLAAIGLAEIAERPARRRHGRAELAPHHPVAHDDDERNDPAEHGLRSTKRGHQQRDRDERADPDHVDHVERRGLHEAEPARKRVGQHLKL